MVLMKSSDTKYYGASAPDKLYHRLETTISNQGLLYVLRNGIEDMGCKLKVCFFKPESDLNSLAVERYQANILGCPGIAGSCIGRLLRCLVDGQQLHILQHHPSQHLVIIFGYDNNIYIVSWLGKPCYACYIRNSNRNRTAAWRYAARQPCHCHV